MNEFTDEELERIQHWYSVYKKERCNNANIGDLNLIYKIESKIIEKSNEKYE